MFPIRTQRAANALWTLIRIPGQHHRATFPIAVALVGSRSIRRLTTFGSSDPHADLQAELLDGVTFGDYPSRTHKCGHLNKTNLGEHVVLTGWAQNLRKFSDELIFLPLRDHSGTVQVILKGSDSEKDLARQRLQDLTAESVICVEGRVVSRDASAINPKMVTGDIEIDLISVCVLNKTHKVLPFLPSNQSLVSEEIRLKYRCLDLRRTVLQRNLRDRSLAAWVIRDYLTQHDFVEVETPMLFKSTPEGAREFVVPTRISGSFYALPQSPQQYKQLLMASGMDRYFQIAKCFRDEDLRADRQPEFTQVDLEMSFGSARDIQTLVEGLVRSVWRRLKDVELFEGQGFPRMEYQLAMSKIQHVADITDNNMLETIVLKKAMKLSGSDLNKLVQQNTKGGQTLLGKVRLELANVLQSKEK
ncbi:hypothetical protein BGZ65_001570 [Modicella reniformis]|uniref:Aminoacyl-transfer RNA synthetases class-II family profile domain-containing protein n=1 Tax=Modicella reniformis TaxID=1440133 RepID=A0A9P6MBJ5_9FUNG|nr:hypothetical protein BGZ65_001570 [Modicella reniformis]